MCNQQAQTILLSQTTYIKTILNCFSLSNTKPYATLIVPGANYTRLQGPADAAEVDYMHKIPYCEAIGSLMYVTVATHPNITFAISTLSQFLNNPGCIYWEAVKQVFCYLSGTKTHALTYGNEHYHLTGFTDANKSSQEHHHAISSYTFLIDGGAVSWASKKQELITLSTAEAKYVTATHAAKDAYGSDTLWSPYLALHLLQPPYTVTTKLHYILQLKTTIMHAPNISISGIIVGDPHCLHSMVQILHARSGPYIDIPLPLIDVLFVL